MFAAPCRVSGCASVTDSTKEATPGTRGITLEMALIGAIKKTKQKHDDVSFKFVRKVAAF